MYRTVTVLVTVRSPQALMQTPELAVNIAAFAGPRSSATSGRASGCGRERADGNATPQVTVFVCVCVSLPVSKGTQHSLCYSSYLFHLYRFFHHCKGLGP